MDSLDMATLFWRRQGTKNGPGLILFGSIAAPAMSNVYVVMCLGG